MKAAVWIAAAAFAAGVVTPVHAPVIVSVGVVASAMLLFSRRNAGRIPALVLLCFTLGSRVTDLREPSGAARALADEVAHCEIEAVVVEDAGGLGTLLRVEKARCDRFLPVTEPGVVITDTLEHDAGTIVLASGWFVPLTDDDFDLARARAGAVAAFDATRVVHSGSPSGPLAVASAVRRSVERASGGLDPRAGALLQGLTIGKTDDIDEGTVERFRRTGLAHLVAVSGSNVAMVLGAVVLLVRRLSLWFRLTACAVALGLFVLIVGPDAPVLRATCMGAVALIGIAVGRRSFPLQALGVSLLILFALRPALVMSVGLHLSAAATAGLVLWTRPLANAFVRAVPRPVALALGATVAAQAAVAPIMSGVFGELSLVAPVANLLALPAVPGATLFGLVAGVAGTVHPVVGGLVARAAEPFVWWIITVADALSTPSWAAVSCPPWLGWALGVPVVGAAAWTIAGNRR